MLSDDTKGFVELRCFKCRKDLYVYQNEIFVDDFGVIKSACSKCGNQFYFPISHLPTSWLKQLLKEHREKE